MSRYAKWKSAFDQVTLREDGDDTEQLGAREFLLDVSFHAYQSFWRNHVVPATNRPANINLRVGCRIGKTATISHSIFLDVLHANQALGLVEQGQYGIRLKNVIDVIKYLGDAVQKVRDFVDTVEKEILDSMYPPDRRELWPANTFETRWKAKREEIIEYRNHLTHFGNPYVANKSTNTNERVPCILRHTVLQPKSNLSYDEQKAIYDNDQTTFGPVIDVCKDLQYQTMLWLNDVYEAVTTALDRYVEEPGYHRLLGWDTFVLGSINQTTGLTHTSGSGSGVA